MRGAQLRCGDCDIFVDRRRCAKGRDHLVAAGFEFFTSAACSADEDFRQHRRAASQRELASASRVPRHLRFVQSGTNSAQLRISSRLTVLAISGWSSPRCSSIATTTASVSVLRAM